MLLFISEDISTMGEVMNLSKVDLVLSTLDSEFIGISVQYSSPSRHIHAKKMAVSGSRKARITNDHCGPGSEDSLTCQEGAAKDDAGTTDASNPSS